MVRILVLGRNRRLQGGEEDPGAVLSKLFWINTWCCPSFGQSFAGVYYV